MYTRDEVRGLLDDAAKKVRGTVESELENASHSTDLLLRQVMKQATAHSVKLPARLFSRRQPERSCCFQP